MSQIREPVFPDQFPDHRRRKNHSGLWRCAAAVLWRCAGAGLGTLLLAVAAPGDAAPRAASAADLPADLSAAPLFSASPTLPTESAEALFARLLNDPDNVPLNLAYIRLQIKAGRLQSAAASLERLLLLHPTSDELRLLYGIVLFRLDDPATARQELTRIAPAALNPAREAERQAVLSAIASRTRTLRQAVTAGLGGHYDSNRNSSPASGRVLIGDSSFTLNGTAARRADWGQLGSLGYDLDYDLEADPRRSFYLSILSLTDRQAALNRYDLFALALETGLRGEAGQWTWRAGLTSTQLGLGGGYYLNERGVVGALTRRLATDWDWTAESKLSSQVFHPVTTDRTGPRFSGLSASGWTGLVWRPASEHRLSAALGASRRDSRDTAQSVTRLAIRLGESWSMSKGRILSLSAEAGHSRADAPDQQISATTRRDWEERIGLGFAEPLGTAGDDLGLPLPEELREVTIGLRQEWTRTSSTLTNYSTSNHHSDVLLTRRWEF